MRSLSDTIKQVAERIEILETQPLPPFAVEADSEDLHVQINFHLDNKVEEIRLVMQTFPDNWVLHLFDSMAVYEKTLDDALVTIYAKPEDIIEIEETRNQ